MFWTKVFSTVAGHWLPLAILFVLVALLGVSYGVGRSHANDAWEARWAAQTLKVTQDARATEARLQARITSSDSELNDARNLLTAYESQLRLVGLSLQQLAASPRPRSTPASAAQCVAELARERDRSETLGSLLVEGNTLARELAAERDDAVARLWAAADAWPR